MRWLGRWRSHGNRSEDHSLAFWCPVVSTLAPPPWHHQTENPHATCDSSTPGRSFHATSHSALLFQFVKIRPAIQIRWLDS